MRYMHGGHGSPTYKVWEAMRKRCLNPKARGYERYGGRGITICKEWDDFGVFLRDMGPRPSLKHSLDRYPDNDGNYEPGNCRWATAREQTLNSSNARIISLNGQSLCITDWEKKLGLSQGAITHRLRKGWPIEDALTIPRRERA